LDLRKEFEDLLSKYGYSVLLIRSGKNRRCICWNDKTQESPVTCPYCYGLGFISVVERHRCRSGIANIPETLARSNKQTDYGQVAVPSRVFYFRYNVKPNIKDLLIDCDFDKNGLPILSDYSIYEINTIDNLRSDNGRVEYSKIFCGIQAVQKEIVAFNVRKSGVDLIYDIGFRR